MFKTYQDTEGCTRSARLFERADGAILYYTIEFRERETGQFDYSTNLVTYQIR